MTGEYTATPSPPLPKDPNWCPQVGVNWHEGWVSVVCVSVEPVKVEGNRQQVVTTFVIQHGDEQASLRFQASPVGNGRAFRSAILKAIATLAVK